MASGKKKGVDAIQRLSPVQNTLLGVSAGAIEVTLLQPMLYCKNATQQGLPFTMNPRVLYRGLAMSVTNMGILTGLQFPLTGAVTKVITGGEKRKLSGAEQIAAGFVGGALSGLACAPMELVMVQQQRFGGSLPGTAARIASTYGVAGNGLMRGLITSCGREGLFTAGYLGIGPTITQNLVASYNMGQNEAKVAGAIGAGVIAATLSHPLDTIKTCMQGDIEQAEYKSLTATARSLLAQGGYKRFFDGWSWRTGRMICAVFIMNECKVRLAPLLFPDLFAEE